MKKKVHVQVYYSPSCLFSFRELERIRKVTECLSDQIVYEEINMYTRQDEAEKHGFYGLLSREFLPVFIDGRQFRGDFTSEELGNAIRTALAKA